jgi:hypothetical protein
MGFSFAAFANNLSASLEPDHPPQIADLPKCVMRSLQRLKDTISKLIISKLTNGTIDGTECAYTWISAA